MGMRITPSGAAEANAREDFQAKFGGFEQMLIREDDRGRNPMGHERTGNRPQLDGFGPGADDQPDVGETQPSP
jgi:hypothetical protein